MKGWTCLTVVIGLALVACGGNPDEPPPIRLVVDGAPVEGAQGNYCWTGPGGGVCEDRSPPDSESAHSLGAGEPIRLQLDAPYPHWVNLALCDDLSGEPIFKERIRGAESLTWEVQPAPGSYLLVVSAEWERQGGATYFFSLTVE